MQVDSTPVDGFTIFSFFPQDKGEKWILKATGTYKGEKLEVECFFTPGQPLSREMISTFLEVIREKLKELAKKKRKLTHHQNLPRTELSPINNIVASLGGALVRRLQILLSFPKESVAPDLAAEVLNPNPRIASSTLRPGMGVVSQAS